MTYRQDGSPYLLLLKMYSTMDIMHKRAVRAGCVSLFWGRSNDWHEQMIHSGPTRGREAVPFISKLRLGMRGNPEPIIVSFLWLSVAP